MSSSSFIRWGGLACVLGGLAYLAGMSFLFPRVPYYWSGRIHAVLLAVLLLGVLMALAATARLYALREEDDGYRRIGILVSLTTFVGVTLLFSGAFIEGLVGAPVQQVTLFERSLGQLVPLFLMFGLPITIFGLLLLAILTLVSGTLPRWCGVMFIAGSPPVWIFLASLTADERPEEVAIPALAWALVGYALFRTGTHQSQQSSRVRYDRLASSS